MAEMRLMWERILGIKLICIEEVLVEDVSDWESIFWNGDFHIFCISVNLLNDRVVISIYQDVLVKQVLSKRVRVISLICILLHQIYQPYQNVFLSCLHRVVLFYWFKLWKVWIEPHFYFSFRIDTYHAFCNSKRFYGIRRWKNVLKTFEDAK